MSKKCISCGAMLDDDELFCGDCGAKQVVEPEPKAKKEKAPKAEKPQKPEKPTITEEDKQAFIQAEAEAKARLELEREEKEKKKAERKSNPKHFAMVSLILGIVSCVGILTILGPFITVPVGLVFGFLGLKSEKKMTSIVGIGLNILTVIMYALILIFA